MSRIIVAGRKVGADRAFWKTLSTNEEVFRRVVEMVNSAPMGKAVAPSDTFKVTVDYRLALEFMVGIGKYGYANSGITADRFPHDARVPEEVEIHLVHLGRTATTREVIAEFDKRNLRPATLPELLALGAAHPDLQRKFWIVALGSIWRGLDDHVNVTILCEGGRGRRLDLAWDDPGHGWDSLCRFLAVRK